MAELSFITLVPELQLLILDHMDSANIYTYALICKSHYATIMNILQSELYVKYNRDYRPEAKSLCQLLDLYERASVTIGWNLSPASDMFKPAYIIGNTYISNTIGTRVPIIAPAFGPEFISNFEVIEPHTFQMAYKRALHRPYSATAWIPGSIEEIASDVLHRYDISCDYIIQYRNKYGDVHRTYGPAMYVIKHMCEYSLQTAVTNEYWLWRNIPHHPHGGYALSAYCGYPKFTPIFKYAYTYGRLQSIDDKPAIIISSMQSNTTIAHIWCDFGAYHRDNDLPAAIIYYRGTTNIYRDTSRCSIWFLRNSIHRTGPTRPSVITKTRYSTEELLYMYGAFVEKICTTTLANTSSH